ncbi:Carotene biosynthesis-related protein CBR, chloroplastic [Tetrabaena socialis]|uniref:Carotene biosynthesis-related protein CBR, chloroplastic n=1 Tax=Tetrabaena socialis TaxID=47790 RepID=A0A2J8A5B2_9CHLO|nr:Carotene biosynthesis-related protein CBR, chloroplastic [Tetrabaena socialis]|eukprot:PNH07704.1 Carotene biosynthesis-related protein CBR, chloroplastic [Tetrabaena socialis]
MAAQLLASTSRQALVSRARVPAIKQRNVRMCRVAAAPKDVEETPAEGTVFYGGQSYTPEEWTAAEGGLERPAAAYTPTSQSNSTTLAFNDVMGFSGSAPEVVNGRLAMLGFVAAVGAELASGESVLKQWAEEPTLITLAFLLFIGGSLVTAFNAKRDAKLGPFTPQAEMINGRAAMIGFASLLIIEAVKGSPLF